MTPRNPPESPARAPEPAFKAMFTSDGDLVLTIRVKLHSEESREEDDSRGDAPL